MTTEPDIAVITNIIGAGATFEAALVPRWRVHDPPDCIGPKVLRTGILRWNADFISARGKVRLPILPRGDSSVSRRGVYKPNDLKWDMNARYEF